MTLEALKINSEHELDLLKVKKQELENAHQKLKKLLADYHDYGSQLYHEIMRTVQLSYQKGEIDFFRLATSTETALQIELDYLNNLLEYNQVTIELNHLSK